MENKLDLIILGATGFTGNFVIKYLAIIAKQTEYSGITWAVSGRSKDKLQKLLVKMEAWGVDTTKITVIQIDIKNETSITSLTKKAKVLINCTGLNTQLSVPVVKACIETRTHYVDLSAERYHILKLYEDYNREAEENNVLVVPSCGFASITVTAGLMYLQSCFKGKLDSVDCYVEFTIPWRAYLPYNNCLVNYGTWESLVEELGNFRSAMELKKNLFPDIECAPDRIKRSFIHHHQCRLWFPYPGPDKDVVEMSQISMKKKKSTKPYYFQMFATTPTILHFIIIVPVFLMYYFLSFLKCFRNALKWFPRLFTLGLFSRQGPSDQMRDLLKYKFEMIGRELNSANPNSYNKINIRISGNDPGYRTTALCVIFSAISILFEQSVMPKGGVVFPVEAFNETQILRRLKNENVMYFENI